RAARGGDPGHGLETDADAQPVVERTLDAQTGPLDGLGAVDVALAPLVDPVGPQGERAPPGLPDGPRQVLAAALPVHGLVDVAGEAVGDPELEERVQLPGQMAE